MGPADLESPQMWTSAFWGTSVCSGAARTCLECSAVSVMRAMSWTAAVVTAQVWRHWRLGMGDAGLGARRGTAHFFAAIVSPFKYLLLG